MDGGEMDDGTSPKATMQRHRPVADDDNDTTRAADAESLPAQVGQDNAHLFVFSNSKAGMKSVDKERVNRVIYEMSKNSSYFKQAKLQDQKLDSKVADMKVKLGALDNARKAQLTRQADRIATELEAQRELDSVCLVIDMDMFYAAVEIRDRPELKDKPVAVGGESMISTTNYHARLKGVRSAMPGFIGRKLCPELVFVKPDYQKYTVVAEQIREIFREYDPRMRSYSLDEAYLNVTQALARRLGLDDPSSERKKVPAAGTGGGSDNTQGARGADAAAATSSGDASIYGKATTHDDVLAGCPGGSQVGLDAKRSDTSRRRGRAAGARYLGDEEDEEGEEEEHEEGRGVEDGGLWTGEGGVRGESTRGRSRREERRARMFQGARGLAEEIRRRIRETTKLTASVGIGPNFMLAKIASDWNKPDGQMCIGGDRAEVLRFLHDLPVRKIGGVGKVQEKCLREAMGVLTCGDLFRERAACLHVMTPHTSRWLIKVSLGIASADHDVATEQARAAGAITRKQISKERTFGELYRPQDLLDKCREICDSLAAEMATKGLEAKTIGLKVKTTKFQVRTLDSTGQTYVSSSDELYAVASPLLQKEIRNAAASAPGGKLRLRLMGIRASAFRGQAGAPVLPGQATLDGFLRTAEKTGKAPEEDRWGGHKEHIEDGVRHEEEAAAAAAAVEGENGVAAAGVGVAAGAALGRHTQPPDLFPRPSEAAVGNGDSLAGVQAQGSDLPASATPHSPRPAVTSRGPELWEGQSARMDGSQGVVAGKASVSCPVCGEEPGATSNAALNRHVDACLGMCTAPDEGNVTARPKGGAFLPGRSENAVSRKRAKVSPTGIERFLTPKERA